MYKILLVETDKEMITAIKRNFEQDNFEVDIAENSEVALKKEEKSHYDIIITEQNISEIDGFKLSLLIRKKSEIPIIIISESNKDVDKILGFEHGADDFISKPFNILELKARIKALLRRSTKETDNNMKQIVRYRNLKIDTIKRRVEISNAEIDLTTKEFELLLLLINNEGKVFTRERLLERIWKYEDSGENRTIDVHIRRLREKIEKTNEDKYILTKWGKGYYVNKE